MVGGQLLSQMTDGAVSVVIGIIIVALVSLVVATFGMQIFQFYERYSHPPPPLLRFHFLYPREPQSLNNQPQTDMPGAHSWRSFVYYLDHRAQSSILILYQLGQPKKLTPKG